MTSLTATDIAGRTDGGPNDAGSSLIEALVATTLLSVVSAGLVGPFSLGIMQIQSQGVTATRATDLSRDKLDQLLMLDFADGATDTTVYPPVATGGTGLGGTMAANATVGSTDPAAPVASHVDYLDVDGMLLPSSTSAFYTRHWSIATDATAKIKTITVLTTAVAGAGGQGRSTSVTFTGVRTALQ